MHADAAAVASFVVLAIAVDADAAATAMARYCTAVVASTAATDAGFDKASLAVVAVDLTALFPLIGAAAAEALSKVLDVASEEQSGSDCNCIASKVVAAVVAHDD